MDKTEQVKTIEFKVYGYHCAKDFKSQQVCRFLTFRLFGTEPVCSLYNHSLYENQYGIVRCHQCLKEFD